MKLLIAAVLSLYSRQIGRTKGGMNTKLHAVTDAQGCTIRFFMSAGPVVSDYTGAAALLGSLPQADWLLDRGYDADWLREVPEDIGRNVCIPGRSSRKKTVKYDKRRNCIEIMFGR